MDLRVKVNKYFTRTKIFCSVAQILFTFLDRTESPSSPPIKNKYKLTWSSKFYFLILDINVNYRRNLHSNFIRNIMLSYKKFLMNFIIRKLDYPYYLSGVLCIEWWSRCVNALQSKLEDKYFLSKKITLEYEHFKINVEVFTTTLKQVMSGFSLFHLNFAVSGNIFNIKWFYINWKMVSIFYIKELFVINLLNETQYFYPGE